MNPSILLQLQAPEYDPVGDRAKAISLRSMIDQQKLQAEQLKSAQRANTAGDLDLQESQAFKDALGRGAKLDELLGISPVRAGLYAKTQAEQRKADLENAKLHHEILKQTNDERGRWASAVLQAPEEIRPALHAQLRADYLGAHPDVKPASIPEGYDENWLRAMGMNALSVDQQYSHNEKQLEQKHKDNELELQRWTAATTADQAARTSTETQRHNRAGELQTGATLNETQRHNRASEAVSAGTLGETRRHNQATEVPISSGTGPAGVKGAAALEGINPALAEVVKRVAAYDIPLPGGNALRAPYWQNVLQLATQYDPNFSVPQYDVRRAIRRDFTSGHSSDAIVSFNTALGHLDSLKKAAEGLGNTGFVGANEMINWAKGKTVGNPAMKRFEVARNAVADELTRAFRQSDGSEHEVQAWKSSIGAASTPEEFKAAIDQGIELLASRVGSLARKYERGMDKPKDFRILTDKSAEILQGLGVDPAAFELGTRAPAGAAPAGAAPAAPPAPAAPAAAAPPAAAPGVPVVGGNFQGERVKKVTRIK